jgi:hypothetical protein
MSRKRRLARAHCVMPDLGQDEQKMTIMVKIEAIKKQVESLESFLRSNPFFKDLQDQSPTLTDFDENWREVFLLIFRRDGTEVRFHTNWDDTNISARSQVETVSFAPTDKETLIRFLTTCGYFTGHNLMAALKTGTSDVPPFLVES